MYSRMLMALAATALMAVAPAVAQPLAVKAKGAKKVVFSDRVGKNQFTWSSDAPLEKIKGTADEVSGWLSIDPANPKSVRGTVSAKVASMKSGNDVRDEHLRSANWLNAEKHPEITFVAQSIAGAKVSGNTLTANVTGNFSMNGVTRKVTVPISLKYIDASAATKERAPGDLVMITADFNIALKDFNVAGSKGTIGSKVGEKITISAKLFGSTGL